MIQIICCSCTQQKLRRNGVGFYSDNKFYKNIERIFVAPFPRHPFLRTGLVNVLTTENVAAMVLK